MMAEAAVEEGSNKGIWTLDNVVTVAGFAQFHYNVQQL